MFKLTKSCISSSAHNLDALGDDCARVINDAHSSLKSNHVVVTLISREEENKLPKNY
jgi:hypothetical protein